MGEYGGKKNPNKFPTVIEGRVEDRRLHITIHNLVTLKVQEELDFEPRKTRMRRKQQ